MPALPCWLYRQTAVVSIGEKPAVFVREADGDYLLLEVVLGAHALGKTQVVSGFARGKTSC